MSYRTPPPPCPRTAFGITMWYDEAGNPVRHPNPADIANQRVTAYYDPEFKDEQGHPTEEVCSLTLDPFDSVTNPPFYYMGTQPTAEGFHAYSRQGLEDVLRSGRTSDPEMRARWGAPDLSLIRPVYPLPFVGNRPKWVRPPPQPVGGPAALTRREIDNTIRELFYLNAGGPRALRIQDALAAAGIDAAHYRINITHLEMLYANLGHFEEPITLGLLPQGGSPAEGYAKARQIVSVVLNLQNCAYAVSTDGFLVRTFPDGISRPTYIRLRFDPTTRVMSYIASDAV
jgi:hypothetical protein